MSSPKARAMVAYGTSRRCLSNLPAMKPTRGVTSDFCSSCTRTVLPLPAGPEISTSSVGPEARM